MTVACCQKPQLKSSQSEKADDIFHPFPTRAAHKHMENYITFSQYQTNVLFAHKANPEVQHL
jgi:hypothetical protein